MLTQNLFADSASGIVWKNLTEASGGKVAGFVDFEWGAALCPDGVAEKCEPFKVRVLSIRVWGWSLIPYGE